MNPRLALPAPAAVGEAQDAFFTVGMLDPVATLKTLRFTHERTGAFDPARVAKVEAGAIERALVKTTAVAARRA